MKIAIKDLQKKIPVTPSTKARVKKALLKTCAAEGQKKPGEVTVSFVNDKKIKGLNSRYLKKPHPTDVIIFDSGDKKIMLADIVISTERAIANARAFKTAPLYELYLYTVHGMLHLLGYNDKNIRQRRIMDKKAAAILNKLNIKPTNFQTFKHPNI